MIYNIEWNNSIDEVYTLFKIFFFLEIIRMLYLLIYFIVLSYTK